MYLDIKKFKRYKVFCDLIIKDKLIVKPSGYTSYATQGVCCVGNTILITSYDTKYDVDSIRNYRNNSILNIVDKDGIYKTLYFDNKCHERLNELESGSFLNKDSLIKEINLELLFNEILNDYANYIIPRTNREIDGDVFLEAIIEVNRKVDKLSTDELQLWFKKMKQVNKEYELKGYPYVYNSDIDREAYLVDRKLDEIVTRKM